MARRAAANWSRRQIAGTGYFALQRWGHAVQITRSRIGTRQAARVYVFQSLWFGNGKQKSSSLSGHTPEVLRVMSNQCKDNWYTVLWCGITLLTCVSSLLSCTHTYIHIHYYWQLRYEESMPAKYYKKYCVLLPFWRDKDWDFLKSSLIDGWFRNKQGIKWIHRTTEKRPLKAKVRSSLLFPLLSA